MKKQNIKYIKELANRLPVVYQQSISGFYEDLDNDGNVVFKPNVFNTEINHVRRIRKAYENLGMDGIKEYLEMIHKIQIQRNELVQNELKSKEQELQLDSMVNSTELGSNIDSDKAEDPLQANVGVLGGAREKRKRVVRKDKKIPKGLKEI